MATVCVDALPVAPVPAVIGRRRTGGRSPADPPPDQLAEGLRRGDPDALGEIHRTYGRAVLGYLRGVLRDPAGESKNSPKKSIAG